MEHKFKYDWTLKDAIFTKDKGKVFSTFSCGGGSTMGYKLAGFDVIGNLEIDKDKNDAYVANHKPKYNFCEDIRKFKLRDDLPDELYNLDILDGSPPCFLAGTLVMTSNGLKPIEDVTTDDKVLTHNNRFKPVCITMRNKREGYYDVRFMGSLPIQATANHPFYVRTMKRTNEGRSFGEPHWKEVKDLVCKRKPNNEIVERDYVGIAINQNAIVPSYKDIVFDGAFFYMLGRWFGDGWVREFINDAPYSENIRYTKTKGACRMCGEPCMPHGRYKGWWSLYCSDVCRSRYNRKRRKKNRHTFIICCGKSDKDELQAIIERTGYRYHVSEQKSTYRFCIENKNLVEYVRQFGKGAENKHLTSDILDLPVDLLEQFIEGYLSADGCEKSNNEVSFASVSKELVYGMAACIHKVYHTSCCFGLSKGGEHTIEGRVVMAKDAYHARFRRQRNYHTHSICEDGYIWTPFRDMEYFNEEVDTYNLSVLDDNSYTVNNLIYHNCLAFSMVGDREEAWGKESKREGVEVAQTWDDLFFDQIDLAKKLQPKVCICENVKGILLGNAIDYVRRIYEAFDEAGYYCRHFLLNGSKMGVPQRRERVFFVCLRKDLAEPFLEQYNLFEQKPAIDMTFNEPPIYYGEFADEEGRDLGGKKMPLLWDERKEGDIGMQDAHERIYGKKSFYSQMYLYKNKIPSTLTAHEDSLIPFHKKKYPSKDETCKISSYPTDYDFGKNTFFELCGRSVPPVMMAQISSRVYEQWLSKI